MNTVLGIVAIAAVIIVCLVLISPFIKRRGVQAPKNDVAPDHTDRSDTDKNDEEQIPDFEAAQLPPELEEAKANVENNLTRFTLFVKQYILDESLEERFLQAAYSCGHSNMSADVYKGSLRRLKKLSAASKRSTQLTFEEVVQYAPDIETFETLTRGIEATFIPKDVIPPRLAVHHAVQLHHYNKRSAVLS
jgi:hypothetical protein